jgi:hypothetical protein
MPLEQTGVALTFYAFYVATKQGVTGITVTVDVWRINTSASPTQVVTAGSATEVGGGLYLYQLASASVTVEGEYIAIFKTASTTPDQQHIPAIWVVSKAGTEYLDASVASRLPTASYTAPSSVTSLQADVTTILGRTDVATSTRLASSAYAPSTGSGSSTYVVTIRQPDGLTAIEGCAVWISTDSAGATVVAGTLYTSAAGVATFTIDPGAYYLWRQLGGWNFSNPTAITVT